MSVPEDWTPPKWLTGPKYTVRELQWLTFVQDQRNRELRGIITQLREHIDKLEGGGQA